MGNINLLNKALNFSKIVNLIHIGAHKGEEINLYETYEFEKIYLVEPIKECADLIEKKIRNNPRFELFNCAMGSENKFLKFFVADGEDSGSSSLLAPRKSDILFSQIVEVEVKTFSSLNIKNIDAAVIDTQGYEIEVLKGFEDDLQKLNIAIVEFANYEGYINQPTYKTLNKFMRSQRFVPVDQIKRINKPIPSKMGGSFGDILYVRKDLLRGHEIIFYIAKNYITNHLLFDIYVYSKKTFKKYIKNKLEI